MTVACISDIHLCGQNDPKAPLFADCLHTLSKTCARVYILGDLFDFWIGDDAEITRHDYAIQSIRRAAEHADISLLVGNRDFLLGDDFAHAADAVLIEEPYVLDIAKKRFVLCHGDTLLTDDVAYQQFRTTVRNTQWQRDFLTKDVQARLAIATQYRTESQTATAEKSYDMFIVDEDAAATTLANCAGDVLIHGHIHRREHTYPTHTTERYSLADWHPRSADILFIEQDGSITPATYP